MYQKEAAETPNCQSQFLGYWLKPMTVIEKIHEEEIEILCPLLLISDSWLWALAVYKPPDPSWAGGMGGGCGHTPWSMTHGVPLSAGFRIKATFVSPSNSVSVFFIWLHWAEKAKILASSNSSSWPLSVELPWKQGSRVTVNSDFLWVWAQTWDCRAMWFLGVYLTRNLVAGFDSSRTHLYPHWECRRVPFCLYPLQHIFSVHF